VRRLGGRKEIDVDIRVVAATNKDLERALANNELREDLYYRLAVVPIFLPPLRERMGDIKLLANEFLARYSRQNNKKVTGFDDAAWDWIISYSWPGNVRELKNAVERAVIMARGTTISAADIVPRHLRTTGEMPAVVNVPVGSSLADAKRQLVLRTFASTGGDVERSAKLLGIPLGELRGELSRLLSMNGGDGASHAEKRPASVPAAAAAPKPKKADPKAKKRR
jgi:transcriptional regulator with PAS, ATPase and Fis domain